MLDESEPTRRGGGRSTGLDSDSYDTLTASQTNRAIEGDGLDVTFKSRSFLSSRVPLVTLLRNFQFRPFLSQMWGSVTVEPMLFLHMVALSSMAVTVQNFYIDTICVHEYSNQTSICKDLPSHKGQETHVEAVAAIYKTYQLLIEAAPCVLFSLFLGPWSDRYGSKLPMILSLVGYFINAFLYLGLSHHGLRKELEPWSLLVASIPLSMTGGFIAFVLSAFRYVATISSVESRSFRIAVCEGSWFLGAPVGLLGSSWLYNKYGYPTVFLVSLTLFGLALIYVTFCVKNDRIPLGDLPEDSHMIKDMFNLGAVKETFLTVFRARPGLQRRWILLLVGTLSIRVLTLYGSMNITYLYARDKFGWDQRDYSAYTTIDGVIGLSGSVIMVILCMKIFKIPDTLIGLLSGISYVGGSITWMLASQGWMMYLGAVVQMFCGLISIVVRSLLSKIVANDELGKVYSFLASAEATMPIIAAPLFNLLFVKTVEDFPGAVYLTFAALNSLIVISFGYFIVSMRGQPHEELSPYHVEDSEERRRSELLG